MPSSDFLDRLHDVGGQMVVNLSHEIRIRKLERNVRWLSLMVIALVIAMVIFAR